MANEWSIILPEAATNLVTNPSIETATTGYTAVGGSIAQSGAYTRRGIYSLLVTPTAGTTDGVYYGTVSLTSGTTYTVSVDVLGAFGIPYKLYFADTSAVLKGTATTFSGYGAGIWLRQTVSWACDSTASYRIYITKNSSANTDNFLVDGLQCVALSHGTSYLDGDQGDGYIWNGTAHASTSSRAAWARSGGDEYFLDTDVGVRVQLYDGIGMPPVIHHSQSYALLPGAQFQGTRTAPRVFTLTIRANGTSVTNLHSIRKILTNLIRPDLVKPEQPFILRYYGAYASAYRPVEISAVYDSGLDFTSPTSYRDDVIAFRCISYDPYWYETGYQSAILDANDTITSRYIAARPAASGQWDDMNLSSNPATDGTVYCIVESPTTKKIYIGGNFTHWGGVAGRDFAACYDPQTDAWSDVGADDDFNGIVYDMVFHPDGTLYMVGSFTDAGTGGDGDRFCKYVEATNTVSSVVAGASAVVNSIAVAPNGYLYLGGQFADWGDAAGDGIVSWTGAALASLGTGLDDNVCNDVAVDTNGNVYITGTFTGVGGVASTGFAAEWNGTAWVSIGVPQAYGTALAVTPNGDVILGGNFTDIDSNADCKYIGVYTGGSWIGLGGGASAIVYRLLHDSLTGMLYAGGSFSSIGEIDTSDYAAVWNGSTWSHLDINFPSLTVYGLCVTHGLYGSTIYVGTSATGAAYFSGDATVTNSGTVEAYPVFKVKRTGGTSAKLKYLENATIGIKVWFDYDLAAGETLTVDFRPGKRSIKSSYYGDVWRALLKGSNFGLFSLLPGTNTVTCFVDDVGSPTILASLEWKAGHWSVDGAAA